MKIKIKTTGGATTVRLFAMHAVLNIATILERPIEHAI